MTGIAPGCARVMYAMCPFAAGRCIMCIGGAPPAATGAPPPAGAESSRGVLSGDVAGGVVVGELEAVDDDDDAADEADEAEGEVDASASVALGGVGLFGS